MSVEQLFTKLHKRGKMRRHLLLACYVLAFMGHAFVSLVELAARHWVFSIVLAVLALMYGCLAFALYTASRRASGE